MKTELLLNYVVILRTVLTMSHNVFDSFDRQNSTGLQNFKRKHFMGHCKKRPNYVTVKLRTTNTYF